MTIGEVARQAGVRASTIRYYEQLGVLPPPPRVSGRRVYGPEILERLAILRFTRAVGFSLDEAKRLLAGASDRPPPPRWRAMARRKLAELERALVRTRAMRAALAGTLRHRCPKLVERGAALRRPAGLRSAVRGDGRAAAS